MLRGIFRLTPVAVALTVAIALSPGWLSSASANGDGAIAYTKDARAALQAGAVPVDARALAACQERSIAGARCLPAADFLGPHGRLANIRDILWLLGTAGLAGDEHVLVVGNAPRQRDFVAGILYLAGQRKISILTEPMARSAGLGADAPALGSERAMSRQKVFQAPMRDHLIVLREELAAMMRRGEAPGLLDGRSEAEYWGGTVRALRGGHLPGAQHLAAAALRAALASNHAFVPDLTDPIVYGHGPYESIAYLTLLRAGAGVAARVYMEGWSDWAAHTALPADSVTYADAVRQVVSQSTSKAASRVTVSWPLMIAALLGGGGLVAGGFFLGRRRVG